MTETVQTKLLTEHQKEKYVGFLRGLNLQQITAESLRLDDEGLKWTDVLAAAEGEVSVKTATKELEKIGWKRTALGRVMEEDPNRLIKSASNGNGNGNHGTTNEAPKEINGCTDFLELKTILNAVKAGDSGDAELLSLLHPDLLAYDHSSEQWFIRGKVAYELDKTRQVGQYLSREVAAQYDYAVALLRLRGNLSEADEKLIESLQRRAGNLGNSTKIEHALKRAAAHPKFALAGNEWDADKDMFAAANCLIDTRDGSKRDATADDKIRFHSNVEWKGLDEPCPLWEKTLKKILVDDETIHLMQLWFGYCATGHSSEDKFVVLHGASGRNGKRVVTESVASILNLYAEVGDDDLLIQTRDASAGSHKQFLVDIIGKRLVLLSETNQNARFNMSRLKRLSGSDKMKARAIYGRSGVEIKPTYKIILSTNPMPHCDPDDEAFFDRLILVPFTQRFLDDPNPIKPNEHQRNPNLTEELKAEYSGILAWIIKGAIEWHKTGLVKPENIKQAKEEYKVEEDIFGQWKTACCIIEKGCSTPSADAYDSFRAWCRSVGIPCEMTPNAFGRRMGKEFFKQTDSKHTYTGIGIKLDAPKWNAE